MTSTTKQMQPNAKRDGWSHGLVGLALDRVPSGLLVRLPGMTCRLTCVTLDLTISDFRQLLKTVLFTRQNTYKWKLMI